MCTHCTSVLRSGYIIEVRLQKELRLRARQLHVRHLQRVFHAHVLAELCVELVLVVSHWHLVELSGIAQNRQHFRDAAWWRGSERQRDRETERDTERERETDLISSPIELANIITVE